MDLYTLTLLIYNASMVPIIAFSIIFIIFSLINIFIKQKREKYKLKELPFVSVQIPSFNDPVAARCVEHCMRFDYPKDKYEIIIVDDSTNPETQALLMKYADENPGFVKYTHRNNRHGFKPGALKEAMKITKGEILVLFDADWMPKKDFLKKIVQPFADEKIAIVQTKQGFYNKNKNWITRFAAYTLMMYHEIVMPIHDKANSVFFCGTAGAIRRSAFEEVGGWNTNSITEDSELTVRLLKKGYKTKYLPIETKSEVPETIEGFVKQQMRWCYGNTRVFIDNFSDIWLKKGLTLKQRIMITYVTLGNIIAPVVIIMTITGMLGWFTGEPKLFTLSEFWNTIAKFIYTAGFVFMGIVMLLKRKTLKKDIKYLVYTTLSVGIVLALTNSYAFLRAVVNKKLTWHCTPKKDNSEIAKTFVVKGLTK